MPFLPQLVRPTQVLEGIDLELAPLLLGYVVTRPKPTCEFILASENGDPVLAWWRYGLGMTVAFTSDAKARWASEWLAWPDFGPFWAQVIRHAMRKNESRGIFVDIESSDGSAKVMMDTVDAAGRFIDQAETTLTVIGPRLKTEKIAMLSNRSGSLRSNDRNEATRRLPNRLGAETGRSQFGTPITRPGRRLPGRITAATNRHGDTEANRQSQRRHL